MALLHYNDVGISALAACVPRTVIDNSRYTRYFPEDEVRKVVERTGIYERRFADAATCSSDLCQAAAERLFADTGIDRSEIDLLVFISQTPDYRMPATSILLQDRLGLGTSTIAFDLTLGCSGFIFGLSTVFALMQQKGLRRALLLDGETRSKVYSPKDRRTAFLFGDAGIAAIIERGEQFGHSYFSLNSDGSLGNLIKIDGGGYRNMSSEETLREKVVDEFGNIRSDEQGYMNGADVFSFVIAKVPKDIRRLLDFAGCDIQDIDHFIFHQANNYMNTHIARKLKIAADRIPTTIGKYGNTSSVSIPLTIASELQKALATGNRRLLLSAFGVGMSWGTACIHTSNCHISDIVEL